MVLFILVYFAVAAAAKIPSLNLARSKIEMTPNNVTQYVQFDDISYNLTDFAICTWIKFSNFSQTQTIFRLTGNKKESVILWRVHAHPKETMRVTVKNKLIVSEATQLTKGLWNHVCFQWKGSNGVWALFVNAKIYSVGQIPDVGNDTTSAGRKWHGKGVGILGDDTAPCRNRLQAYGLYMTGSPVTVAGDADSVAKTNGGGKTAKSRRQAVFDDTDADPSLGTGGATTPKPFQWFTKSFAFVKRMFTFVIIPFFKFVRNTFFQTRSVDDTVVDVSETHLTEVKFAGPLTADEKVGGRPDEKVDGKVGETAGKGDGDASRDKTAGKGDGDDEQRRSSKRETDDECGDGDDRLTAADLMADDALSPNAKRHLRMVSDGLNDVGVNAAFAKRAFACCRPAIRPRANVAAVVDWDRVGGVTAHNVTVSPVAPQACGRF